MLIHTHVDDLLVAVKRNCKAAQDIIVKLQKELHLQGGFKKVFEYLAGVVEVYIRFGLPSQRVSSQLT